MKTITIELDGKTYKSNGLMTWGEVEQTEEIMSPAQLNLEDSIRAAETDADKAELVTELRQTEKAQMVHIKGILQRYFLLDEEGLKSMQFLDALLLFVKFYKASTNTAVLNSH
jgi:hypothetical protein